MIQLPLNIEMEKNLILFFCGYEKTSKNHNVGPYVSENYLFHIIHSGSGRLVTQNKEYHLSKGSGFVMFPNHIAQYISDKDNPFEYSWVAFRGSKLKHILDRTNLTYKKNDFSHLNFDFFKYFSYENQNLFTIPLSKELNLKIHAYSFLKELISLNPGKKAYIDKKNETNSYIKAVEDIVNTNFHNKILVSQVASQIGLNTSYLGQLFKKEKGMSIKDYLTNKRMNKACKLLDNTNLEISNISRSVGYNDQLQFTKMFKKHKTLSPSKYRKRSNV